MRLRCASSHAVALFAASLPSCRSGWHRRTSRRSISGGMPSGLARWPSSSSASTRRRRRADSARASASSAVSCASLSGAAFLAAGLAFQHGKQRRFQLSPGARVKVSPHSSQVAFARVSAWVIGGPPARKGHGRDKQGTNKGQNRDTRDTNGRDGQDNPLKGVVPVLPSVRGCPFAKVKRGHSSPPATGA